ncbi:MAG: restriction endonuclease subunit S [Cyclobacteriaceae bacterium]
MALPKGWVKGTLNDIISPEGIFIDGDWIESKDQDPEGEIRLIQLADIKELKFVSKSDRFLTRHKSKELGCTYLKKDDVLIARMPDPIGRACLFPYEDEVKYVTVVDVAIVRTGSDSVLQKWLMYTINAPDYRKKIQENASGSTRLRISRKNLGILELPLPPFPEQKRIVAKLDKLFAHFDQLKARLENVPALLKQFRQAVLTQAVTGKLTEEWREGKTVIESGEQLLQRIEMEITNGSKERLPRGYKTTDYLIEYDQFNLPAQWSLSVIDKIGVVQIGGTPSRAESSYWNGDIRWVSSGEVDNSRIKDTTESITKKGLESSSVKVLPIGTVLIAMIGEGKTRGQSSILDIEAGTNQNVAAIVTKKNHFNPEFLWFFMLANYEKHRGEGRGANQPALNGQKVGAINIPIPPLEEQEEIVLRVESLFAIADKIEASYNTLKEKIDQLPQAILSKAFRGELVAREVSTYTGAVEELSMAAEEKRIYNKVKS